MEPVVTNTAAFDAATQVSARLPRERRLNLLPLIVVIFFIVSGGAYGLEPVVSAVGAGWAVVLVASIPVLWSLPIALMVAELSSAMPEEGGYYVWVRNALGDFWGVQEGWWTIGYTAVDTAIYPVLFVNYLAYFYPPLQLNESSPTSWGTLLARWLIAVAVIAAALAVNWRGARAVGHNAALSTGVVLVPFVVLVIAVLMRKGAPGAAVSAVAHDLASNRHAGLLAIGLSTVMWNYMGWDNTSTFAGEVNDARRNYPRALAAALPLTVAAYLLPLLAGIAVTIDPDMWSESKGWPVIARLIGGDWLGVMIAGAALVSMWSLFNSQVFYVSRLPYAMARDCWLPATFARVSKRTGVPVTALVASCVFSAIFAALSFGKLVVIDVLLYSSALSLEFIALIALRWRRPEMARPFRVPGGWLGIALITLAPMCCAGVVLITSLSDKSADLRQTLIVIGVIASGIALYFTRRETVERNERPAGAKNSS